jgi:crotonobetainyl-CoA:carnitine CoA-transferase CaiB-like acyl-CoA transferase
MNTQGAYAGLRVLELAENVLEGGAPRQLNAPTGAYRTRDGWIIVALVREEQYVRLIGALGRPDHD